MTHTADLPFCTMSYGHISACHHRTIAILHGPHEMYSKTLYIYIYDLYNRIVRSCSDDGNVHVE